MTRPIILGVVGDSASGKTTLTRALIAVLGKDAVTHIAADDYHRYDRRQRSELAITALHPDCNHIDILAQHVDLLRGGQAILKPVYAHHDGTFRRPQYVEPKRFVVVEGLLGYHTEQLTCAYDVRVFLDPAEDLRREWKLARDCARRGYTRQQVLDELARREPDSAAFIRPQRARAHIVVSFRPGGAGGAEQLDVLLTLRNGLAHPDLPVLREDRRAPDAIRREQRGGMCSIYIPGNISRDRCAAIEEQLWEKLHFARHLRTELLGELKIANDRCRSEALWVVQLLILYHLVTTTAAVALRGNEPASRTRLA